MLIQRHVLPTVKLSSAYPHEELRKTSFVDMLSWSEEDGGSHVLGGSVNRVVRTAIVSLCTGH